MLSVRICILLFVVLCRLAADSGVVERVAMVDETNPLDRAADTYCTPDTTGPVIEVKWENYPDVKMEDVLGNAVEYGDFSVKVRFYAVYILTFPKLAAQYELHICFTWYKTAPVTNTARHSFHHEKSLDYWQLK